MRFTNAIVRKPGRSMVNGLTEAGMGQPNYEKACEQHFAYIAALHRCGLEVRTLEADEAFPDSTFVEDAALLIPDCAIITNPGAPSRRGEVDSLREVLRDCFAGLERVVSPGNVDAGDIMMAENHYYVGLSERTNVAGAEQILSILSKHGLSGSTVNLEKVLHLKTGVSYLENNTLLVSGEFVNHPAFRHFDRIEVPSGEGYAANSLWINDRVLVPAGNPVTRERIEIAGYEVIELSMSEFRKLDGGLSCLSLRW